MRLPLLVTLSLALAACPPPTDPGRPVLEAVPVGLPEISGCEEVVQLTLVAQIEAAYIGADATFEVDGEVLWEGRLVSRLEFTIPWRPVRGDVRGAFVTATDSGGVVFPVRVRDAEPPRVDAFGLYDGAIIVEDADVPAIAANYPWDGALPVDPYEAIAVRYVGPHADLGVETSVEIRRCPAGGDCEVLSSEPIGSTLEIADLADVAAARCSDLSDRSEDRFEVTVTSACGTATGSLEVRVVEDDCDRDTVLAADDCDDQEGAVQTQGDIASDGLPVGSLAEAVQGSEVVVCGGQHTGGWVIDHDLTMRAAGWPVTIEAPGVGPTMTVTGGNVALAGLTMRGGDAGAAGGGAISAADAAGLELVDVNLDGGHGEIGGNLLGPTNGNLTVVGGTWTGGTATSGGNAYVYGGEVRGVLVEYGAATDGGGITLAGPATLIDVDFENNTADRGAGAYVFRSSARLEGCSFLESHAAVAGGGIAAELDSGHLLELVPSSFDLTFMSFEECSAVEGGAVWISGGALDTTYTIGESVQADVGGMYRLVGSTWDDRSSFVVVAEAFEDGAVAALSGGSADLFGTDVLAAGADRGAFFLSDQATLELGSVDLNATGCGVWIDDGSLQSTGMSGSNFPADVCGSAFQSPWTGVCTQDGC